MGNDGGSIPTRRELVKESARQPSASVLKATALEQLAHAWAVCPISAQALEPSTTIASDARGRLYSYEAVLQSLLSTAAADSDAVSDEQVQQQAAFAAAGLRSPRDVVRLNFNVRHDEAGREFRSCPVSMKELGPNIRCVYIVPCGHVFAEVAVRETLGSKDDKKKKIVDNGDKNQSPTRESAAREIEEALACPECSAAFERRDVIPILPSDPAEVEQLERRTEELREKGLTHSLKKDKSEKKSKNKKRKAAANNGTEADPVDATKSKKATGIDSRINNAMTASLTAKVLAEQEERNKRRKLIEGKV